MRLLPLFSAVLLQCMATAIAYRTVADAECWLEGDQRLCVDIITLAFLVLALLAPTHISQALNARAEGVPIGWAAPKFNSCVAGPRLTAPFVISCAGPSITLHEQECLPKSGLFKIDKLLTASVIAPLAAYTCE